MIERHDSPKEKPGNSKLSYPVPNPEDLVVVEFVEQKPDHYKPLDLDTPHDENARLGLELKLVWQGPTSADPNRVARVYCGPRTSEDLYNYAIKYSGDSNAAPIFIRSYLERRDAYQARVKGLPLKGVVSIKLTNEGEGYDNRATAEISGGGGSGATVKIVNIVGGKIKSLRIVLEGDNFVENPTVTINGNGAGSGATAVAFIQPVNAVLVKEEVEKITDEIPEMYNGWTEAMLGGLYFRVIRTYETLPGPWIPYSRWDDNHGAVTGQKRFVLTTTPPPLAEASATFKRTFESREGSSVVSVETLEAWGDQNYDHEFSVEIEDRVPPEFDDVVPKRKSGQTEPGQAAPPTLAVGEFARTSKDVDKFWKHDTVTSRDVTRLPKLIHDYELDELRAGGAGFDNIYDIQKTLTNDPNGLPVERGFLVTESKVESKGAGLTLRTTKKIFDASPARLDLTFPGSGFLSAPIVVFTLVEGGSGSGAAGTPVLSNVPTPGGTEQGGVFDLALSDPGDAEGVLHFLGARYNGGTWANPYLTGVVDLSGVGNPTYPVTAEQISHLVDRQADPRVQVIPSSGGGHAIYVRLGAGRTLKANKITIQQALHPGQPGQKKLRVQGSNDNGQSWHDISTEIPIPQTAGEWSIGEIDDSIGWTAFRFFGTDPHIEGYDYLWPALVLGEIEFYGELTIVPGVLLQYSFDGDGHGAFDYLGTLGGGGTWRNPQTNNDIVVTADALSNGTLDEIVDREASNIFQDSTPFRSYYFDLKSGRELICNKLSVRQRTGSNGAVIFTLQGDSDPDGPGDWQDLAEFSEAASSDEWHSIDVPGATPYRKFRIISPYPFFALGEVEMYGQLTFPQAPGSETFSITGVNMSDGGENYPVPPNVVFEGDGTGAQGTAILDNNGQVTGVLMTANGGGYTNATVDFRAVGDIGSGADVSARINGALTGIEVTDGGTGFLDTPDVIIDAGPGGLGLNGAATAVLGFALDSIPVTAHGSNYLTPPGVSVSPNNGSAHSILSYALDSITVNDGGSGFSSAPPITIDPPTGADGIQATAHAVMGTGGAPITDTLAYTSPGDNAGAFNWIGRNFSGGAWAHPTTNGLSISSNQSIQVGDPNFAVNQTADESFYPDVFGDYIVFDLGTDRQLALTDWTYQSRSVGGAPASDPTELTWEGSNNGVSWTPIDVQSGLVFTVSAEWKHFAVAMTTPFRYFRVTQSAINSSGGNHFCFSEFELYGDFIRTSAGVGTDEIETIVIDNVGFGYLTEPGVAIGGDGTGADADSVLENAGAVDSIVIDIPGLFETVPSASLTGGGGGSGATLGTPVLETAGSIMRIDVDVVGSMYQGNPGITFDTNGGPGSGATAESAIEGPVFDFIVNDGGQNYNDVPLVQIQGDATATANIGGGEVTSLNLIDGGTYEEPPAVVVVAEGGPEGIATIGFGVDHITITSRGKLEIDGVNIANNKTVLIGAKTYTFKTVLTPSEGQVLIGATADESLQNLIYAINHDLATLGIKYSCAAAHPTVFADPLVVAAALQVTALTTGSIAVGTNEAHLIWYEDGQPQPPWPGITVLASGAGRDYRNPPKVNIIGDGRSATAYTVLGRGILRIEVLNGGDNYGSTTHAGASSNSGTGATFTVQRSFGIGSVNLGAGGTGYTSDPAVAAPSPDGTNAILQAIRGLPLRNVAMVSGGTGFTTPPTVVIPSPFGGGTVAVGDAILGFALDSIDMDLMGTNFTSNPNVEVRPNGSGGGAFARAELLGRSLATILVDSGGSLYTSPPTIIVGDGSNGAAHAVLTGDAVTSIVIDDPGTGFGAAPLIYIGNDGGGTGAHAVAQLTTTQDMRIIVTNAGQGFEVGDEPDIIITGGGGSGATAHANLASTGAVKRVELSNLGTLYITDIPITFTGDGTGASATGIRDVSAAGPVAIVTVLQSGGGYIAATINCVFSGGGGTGAAATAIKKTTGKVKSVTVAGPGQGFEDPPIVTIAENVGGVGSGAILRAIMTNTGKVKRAVMTSAGEAFTQRPLITFTPIDGAGSGAAGAAFLTETGSIRDLLLTVEGGPFGIAPLVSFAPPGDAPIATALYILPQNFPTLIDELVEPTNGLIIQTTKNIVPARNPLPPGFSEIQALNSRRQLQLTTKIDLSRMPPTERIKITQGISLPDLLTGVLPVWNTRVATSDSLNGVHTQGSASATAEISGSIVVLKRGGFRGAAHCFLEKTFFFGPPPDASVPPCTIIKPSSGTAFLRGGANSNAHSGGVNNLLNINGQPAQIGDVIGFNAEGQPIIFTGYNTAGPDSSNSSSLSSSLQIVDISDILTAGLQYNSFNGVFVDASAGQAGGPQSHAEVDGEFGVNIPASCPAVIPEGMMILHEVMVEKWRFNIYVRNILFVIAPGDCGAVGAYGPDPS